MLNSFKRLGLTAMIAAGMLMGATSAEARDRYRDRDGGDDAAIAIGAGIVGLAIGAMLADRDDDRYYDRGYYPSRRYVRVRGYPDYYYYYDGYPNRYYRDRYYDRHYRTWYRDSYRNGYRNRYDNRWDRGYNRIDRMYDRNRSRYDDRRYRDNRRWDRRDRGW